MTVTTIPAPVIIELKYMVFSICFYHLVSRKSQDCR